MEKREENIAQLSMCVDVIDDAKDDVKKLIEKLTRYCNYAEDYIQNLKELRNFKLISSALQTLEKEPAEIFKTKKVLFLNIIH